MKKTLMAAMAIVAITFGACKKDLNTQTAQEPKTSATKQKVNVVNPTYYYHDLALQPRNAGENFDTYIGNWGGSSIKVIGTPVWNHDLYPNLVNGVPAYNMSYVPTGGDFVTTSSSGGQDIFTLSVATMSALDIQSFQNDVAKFRTAYSTYVDNTNQGVQTNVPKADDYIKSSYTTTQPGFVANTGKLIRVTTGSHIAIATVDYPMPPATQPVIPPSTVEIGFQITQGGQQFEYDIYLSNGSVTAIHSFNTATGSNNPIASYSGGTFTPISGTPYYHIANLNITPVNLPSFTFTGNSTDMY